MGGSTARAYTPEPRGTPTRTLYTFRPMGCAIWDCDRRKPAYPGFGHDRRYASTMQCLWSRVASNWNRVRTKCGAPAPAAAPPPGAGSGGRSWAVAGTYSLSPHLHTISSRPLPAIPTVSTLFSFHCGAVGQGRGKRRGGHKESIILMPKGRSKVQTHDPQPPPRHTPAAKHGDPPSPLFLHAQTMP